MIYCIVVTYNGKAWIEKCMRSLSEVSMPVKLIAIDNGSVDNTPDIIRERFPQVRIIENKKNLGFGQANNVGIRIAIQEEASQVFLLNQDAWLEHGSLEACSIALSQHKEYGILSPLHLTGSGKALDKNFRQYLMKSTSETFVSREIPEISSITDLVATEFVNAAAWLISRDCILKTGGFDPVFFHYGEDWNFAQRVLYRNFKIGILPSARIYHDRENRLAEKKSTPILRRREEWDHLLISACDIRRSNGIFLILRRFFRHFLFLFPHFFGLKKDALQMDLHVMGSIIKKIFPILKSRHINRAESGLPHL